MGTRKGSKAERLRRVAFTRFMLIIAVLVIWMGGIGVRLVHLQINQHAWFKEKARSVRQDIRQTTALRGSILDRNERALAISVRAKTLFADPSLIENIDETAKAVANVIQADPAIVSAQLKQGKENERHYVPLARKLDDETVGRINKALDVPTLRKKEFPNHSGLFWEEDQRRSYPYQELAAQVVGFSDAEAIGRAGIEQSQNKTLRGAQIERVQIRDRHGRIYEETVNEEGTPSDIVLTIDTGFQYAAEQALERGVREANAKSGKVIVMRPRTGEILALAHFPSYDPNLAIDIQSENIANHAIQSIYAPGSVFKVVTYGTGLEKQLFTPDDLIDSGNGSITVAKHKFSDSHPIGTVSFLDAMARSSNVCAIKTAMNVGREDFFGMMQKMGFGAKTGIELPAETPGIVRPLNRWNGDSLASMSIGYEVGVTALQMATAFATIANDGVRVKPHIIKEIRPSDNSGKIVSQPERSQIMSTKTAQDLQRMLTQVVKTGTGRRAQLIGYSSAGKTGTAWKFNPKTKAVDPTKYISSFIGMAPANDPEIVIAVILDEPKAGARDGGMVAAPIFREIAQHILVELKVAPDIPINRDALIAKEEPKPSESETRSQSSSEASTATKSVKKSDDVKRRTLTGSDKKLNETPVPKPTPKSKNKAVPDANSRARKIELET